MTDAETQEYRRLVNLWHCTEPMTKEQTERMDYLHGLTMKASSDPNGNEKQLVAPGSPKSASGLISYNKGERAG